ncbi:MarR family transcriptional regulator [Labrys sp. LIt4]|uniref:MarR family transcriptional regulator n=1 Tax=Labrys sp. LIt4 TaxID=2821355 RepID=UPI001AE08B52|nr:MarR family transcriptional regulator [Labrys sp. LIt4]MBP0578332.1 MarR family transcriptional regulator [Labrys sp. LIt4]
MAARPDNRNAQPSHRALVEEVGRATRTMGAQSVITSKTVADRFGLNQTDLEVLDLIVMHETASAGELAKATGLTSGSVTALIDRLTAAGYVERFDDPKDRRRVLVRARQDAIEPIKAVYLGLQERMFGLWSTFEAHELEIIADFLKRSTELAVEYRRSLLDAPSPPKRHTGRGSGRS